MNKSPYLNMTDLTIRYKCSKRTIYRWMSLEKNPFPKPKIEQTGVSSLWLETDIDAWDGSMSKVA